MTPMPAMLADQLRSAQRRLWAVETVVAVLGGLCGLLASYLLLFVSDRFWATPAWLRFVCTAAGIIGAALGAWWWVAHQQRRRDPRATARLVQKRYPRLGDRLLSVVELTQADKLPDNISPALVKAAMEQVARESQTMPFDQAVPTHWLRRWTPVAIVAGGLTLAALLLLPAAGWNALKRWVSPLTAEERYTFTQINPLTDRLVVAHGEDFPVAARLKPESRWRPDAGRARIERQAAVATVRNDDTYAFQIPGQTQPGELTVAVGDARETTRVEPMFRPDLTALQAEVELPAYLQYPPQQIDVRQGTLDWMDGSRVRFIGEIVRPLESATLILDAPQALTVRGSTFVSEPLALTPGTEEVRFQWRDNVGLTGRTPFALKVQSREDEVPRVDFEGLQRATAILEDETLRFAVAAEDDFGVKQTALKWQVEDQTASVAPADSALPGGQYGVATGKPQDRSLTGDATFSPRALGLGPGRVTLRAMAVDYKPGRDFVESAPYTVVILDRSDHAKLIQQMLNKIGQQVEELARTEQKQVETTQQLRERLAQLMDQDANRELRQSLEEEIEQLEQQLQAEKAKDQPDTDAIQKMEQKLSALKEQLSGLDDQALQEKLDQLSEELRQARENEQANREAAKQTMEDLKKLAEEAIRNNQIPTETMKQMAEIMQALQQLKEGEMQQAQQSLQNAQNAGQSSQSEQRSEQMERAQQQQEEAMKKLQELAQQIQKADRQLLADTFIKRLEASGRNEGEIGEELGVVGKRTVGATFEQLEPELRNRLLLQKSKQEMTQSKVKNIQDDLGYYIKRQPIQELYDVFEDMKQVRIGEELLQLANLIQANRTGQAMSEAHRWEKQLLAWAKKLKAASEKSDSSGGGQGQGDQNVPEWAIELMLRLIRVRQQQTDIREQTRAVEERRTDTPEYPARAKDLADRQDQLLTEFDNIPEAVKIPAAAQMRLASVWEPVDNAMADALILLSEPNTGGPAIAAETEVIELLGKLLDAASQEGQPQGSGQQQQQKMAQLQQMMSRPSNTAGGNSKGGGTNQASPPAQGSGQGTQLTERAVEKATGRDTASLPVEFREALEGYYNQVDKAP